MNRGKNDLFELVPNDYCVWKLPRALRSTKMRINTCPYCKAPTYQDFTLVPVSNNQKAKIPGVVCNRCGYLFIEQKESVERIMKDNPHSKGFTLDGRELWNATEMGKQEKRRQAKLLRKQQKMKQYYEFVDAQREKMRSIPSVEVVICVRFLDKTTAEFTIVNDRKYENTMSRKLHYSSTAAREILSAAFSKERKHKGVLDNLPFRTTHIVFRDRKQKSLSERLLPTEVDIMPGGGYASSIKNKNSEIVDLLLYSPYTKRYEILKATYNRVTETCGVDAGLFRYFVRKYGNPGLFLNFVSLKGDRCKWGQLNPESVLNEYGYNTSKTDNYSSQYRQELLAELIDLEILTAPQIVRMLDFFISTHTQDKDYIPRLKWSEDKDFVINYKADPKRFLILSDIRKNNGE